MPDNAKRPDPEIAGARPPTATRPAALAHEATGPPVPSDDDSRAVVARLARRHPSGGTVIERAAILAEGPNCATIIAWITAHDGKPEAAAAKSSGGLHGARLDGTAGASGRAPIRYVLPASALA